MRLPSAWSMKFPSPLFTFSVYLGAVSASEPNVWVGAFISLIAVFFTIFPPDHRRTSILRKAQEFSKDSSINLRD